MPGHWAGSTRRSRLPSDWPKIRHRILTRDHGLCQIATPGLCIGTATDVDHILRGDDHTDANLRAACSPCHKAKSAAEGVQARAARPTRTRPTEKHPGLR
jgi:5-methylcytosine-specific restriction protein A